MHGVQSRKHKFGAVYVFSGASNTVIRKHVGPDKGGRFGLQIAGGADFDGDGFPDYVVGSNLLPLSTGEGAAYMYSGATGTLRTMFIGERFLDYFASCVRVVGDVDADGVEEIGIGAPFYTPSPSKGSAGRADVYSGSTSALIHQFTGTKLDQNLGMMCGVGDIDADGQADLLIGSFGRKAGPNGEGKVELYSGATGTLLYTRVGENAFDGFGGRACPLGDVTGDGSPDFAVNAPYFDQVDTEGRVYVYSGPTGALQFTIDGTHLGEAFGALPSSSGIDFNADGYKDVVVGNVYPTSSSSVDSYVLTYSGRTGRLLHEFRGGTYNRLTESLAAVSSIGDLNQDGFDDILPGANNYSANYGSEGRAYVFGGNDLFLQGNQEEYAFGDSLILSLRGGLPGALAII